MADLAISEVRICNMALSNIGASSAIESLTEGSSESNECNLWYTYSRKQSLAAYDWSFARKRLTLATHSDDPPAGVWAYRYQYPSDAVVMRKMQNPSGVSAVVFLSDESLDSGSAEAVPFAIEVSDDGTKSILTNLDEAVGVYTFDQTDVTLFSEFFVSMFSFALASNVAYALTGKQEVREAMIASFQQMFRQAPASNAAEEISKPPRDASWVRGR